jgi:hypothetical protein
MFVQRVAQGQFGKQEDSAQAVDPVDDPAVETVQEEGFMSNTGDMVGSIRQSVRARPLRPLARDAVERREGREAGAGTTRSSSSERLERRLTAHCSGSLVSDKPGERVERASTARTGCG